MADHPRCIHPSIVDCGARRVPLCTPVNLCVPCGGVFWNAEYVQSAISNSNSAIPAALRQNCCPVRSGARNALMETSETEPGHHWSLTLLGMALIIMFAYYGESVLAGVFC